MSVKGMASSDSNGITAPNQANMVAEPVTPPGLGNDATTGAGLAGGTVGAVAPFGIGALREQSTPQAGDPAVLSPARATSVDSAIERVRTTRL